LGVAAWFAGRAICNTPAPAAPVTPAAATAPQRTCPIERIRVGQRVVGENPELTNAERNWVEPDEATWRKLVLKAPKEDGSWADVEIIRPNTWLEEQNAKVGTTVEIHVPECGIHGNAKVLRIEPCPPIEPGDGQVVTATFHHQAATTVDVHVEGLDTPIGCTGNHPFWSEDRQAFVRADALQPGEHLRTFTDIAVVTHIAPRSDPAPVYNIEVQGEHVYHVAQTGVLVHNSGKLCDDVIPPLRKAYEDEVRALAKQVPYMRAKGYTSEQIAKRLCNQRRRIATKFKNRTEAALRGKIYDGNIKRYAGDKLGLTWKEAVKKYKGDYELIIQKAATPGPWPPKWLKL
jgi:hypothetical protein